MMKVGSKFRLQTKTDLSFSDFRVLSLLYQPLIGIDGFSLYVTLTHLSKSISELKHQALFDILNLTKDNFISITEKLEAIGLVETFVRDETDYIYVLKPPYSAKKFLIDTFLGTYLESEIGDKNLKILLEIFKVKELDFYGYENISKTFDDLYSFRVKKLLKVDFKLEERNGNNTKLIRNSIDYNMLIEKLPRALKTPSLFNENFKQKIIQLAYVYQFSISDLIEIFKESAKNGSDLNIEAINFRAKLYYANQNKDIYVEENKLSDEEKIANLPLDTIVQKFVLGDHQQKAMALSTINDFINQTEIDLGVLNILIMFILKNKNGELPHVNYILKVWKSWQNSGVSSISDAISHQEQIEKKWKNKKSYSNEPKVNKPEWLDEYLKEIQEMEG